LKPLSSPFSCCSDAAAAQLNDPLPVAVVRIPDRDLFCSVAGTQPRTIVLNRLGLIDAARATAYAGQL
jgi:hypothetical protein